MTKAKKLKMKFIGLKHGNWYLVEGDKHKKGEFFLVVGEKGRKCSATAEFFPISCLNRENPAIWSQFGPKFQSFTYHDSL